MFAKDVFCRIHDEFRVPTLRHWASFLTLVAYIILGAKACLDIARIVAINRKALELIYS